MPFTYLDDNSATMPQGSSKFTYLDESPAKAGTIDMRADTGDLKGDLKGISDFVQNPVGSISKAITGKTLAENIAGNQTPDTKETPIPEMLAKNAMAGLGEATENVANIVAQVGAGKAIEGLGKLPQAISEAKNGIAKMLLSPEFAQDKGAYTYGQDARRVLTTMPDVAGEDLNSTQSAVKNKMSETGQAIQDTMNNHPQANTKLDVEEHVTAPFDNRIAELNKQNPQANATVIARLQQAKIGLLHQFDENGKLVSPQNLNEMTPAQIWEFRKTKIDPMTKFTGNVSDDKEVNSAYQEARSNLKGVMNSVMPELKPLNRDYGDLSAADEALDKAQFQAQKQGVPNLKLEDIITLGANKWIENPANKIKLAQFLYTAPPEAISSMEEAVPEMANVVKTNFGSEPSLAGRVSKGGEVPAELVQPQETKGIGFQKATIRPDRALPSPQEAGQSTGPTIVPPLKEGNLPPVEDPNGFLAQAKAKMQGNEGNANSKALGVMAGATALAVGANNAEAHTNIDLKKINQIESSGNPKLIGDKGNAIGLNQIHRAVLHDFNKKTGKNYSTRDLLDGKKNNEVADWYLNNEIPRMIRAYGKPDTERNRIIAYNAGISYVKNNKPLPEITKAYLKKYGIK